MTDRNLDRYFEILEVEPDASYTEVRASYERLTKLFGDAESITTLPLDDFSEERKGELLEEIEEAFRELTAALEPAEWSRIRRREQFRDERVQSFLEGVTRYDGHTLRRLRELFGTTLEDVSGTLKITSRCLEDIEENRYGNLPPEVFLKGFLSAYATYLQLDPARVVQDYLDGCRADRTSPRRGG